MGNLSRQRAWSVFLCGLLIFLSSCSKDEPSPPEYQGRNVGLLATDIHVSIAGHTLVLPLIVLDDYAHPKMSFSLNRKRDREQAHAELDQFLRDTKDAQSPLRLESLSVVVKTYGWNDADSNQKRMCPQLTREWARSACDNPWAAIQQALPVNRFRLVDLRALESQASQGHVNCREDGSPRQPIPRNSEEAVLVCVAMVYGGPNDKFHSAIIRVDGDLGVLWTVWRYGQNGEAAEMMMEREGKALVAFVRYAIAQAENFPGLHAEMCRLRRPDAVADSIGVACPREPTSRQKNNVTK